MDLLRAIFTSPAVWAAILALADAIVTVAWPDYPVALWAAIRALIVALLIAAGVPMVQERVRQLKAMREGPPIDRRKQLILAALEHLSHAWNLLRKSGGVNVAGNSWPPDVPHSESGTVAYHLAAVIKYIKEANEVGG